AAAAQRRHAPVRPAAAGEAACDDEGHGPRLIFQPCRLRLMPALQAGQPAGLMRGFAPGRHCVTAFCGLRPLVLQGEVSPCEPLWPASQLYPRLPNPIEHTRPRGIHAPTRSFGIIQTMLLALANFGLERMGREKPQQLERILAACGRMFSFGFWFLVFACVPRRRKPFRLSRWGLFRPIRTGPPLEKDGSHARRDAGQGSWYRMYLTIRGR